MKLMTIRLAIANDHGGVDLKKFLMEQDYGIAIEWVNLGTDTTESTDYPDYSVKLAHCLIAGEADRGVAICGSGIGISMGLNRFAAIRAAVVTNTTMACLTRIDNDANVVCLGARTTGNLVAKDCLEAFLKTEFDGIEGGRHLRRVKKLGTLTQTDQSQTERTKNE